MEFPASLTAARVCSSPANQSTYTIINYLLFPFIDNIEEKKEAMRMKEKKNVAKIIKEQERKRLEQKKNTKHEIIRHNDME